MLPSRYFHARSIYGNIHIFFVYLQKFLFIPRRIFPAGNTGHHQPACETKSLLLEIMTKNGKDNQLTCLYYGPIAAPGKPARGGFEAANRKNITALRERGVKVIEVSDPKKPNIPGGALVYLKMFFSPLRMLPFAGRKNVVAHFTPIKGSLLWAGALGPIFAKFLGIPSVLDIRAGSFMQIYKNGSRKYRWLVRKMLGSATVITVEGKPYLEQLKPLKRAETPMFYFPNLVKCPGEASAIRKRTDSGLNIFYFGRISAQKGIDIIFRTWQELGVGFNLYMAGPVDNGFNLRELTEAGVRYLGCLSPEELKDKMRDMHFFILPSTWSGEGQSNALIEAMAEGLIPITSANGFLPDVAGDCGAVIPTTASYKEYVDAIRKIVAEGNLDNQMEACRKQICLNHNLDTEIDHLLEIYRSIAI